jgi:hypothetical protein
VADEKPEPDTTGEATSTSTSTSTPASSSAPESTSTPTSTSASTSTSTSASTGASKPAASERRRNAGAAVKKGTSTVRSKLASLLWLVAVVCALFLAVGALLVALKANPENPVVKFILDGAATLDPGVFSPEEGLFPVEKGRSMVEATLINWGLAAVAYLIVGKVVDRIIRP